MKGVFTLVIFWRGLCWVAGASQADGGVHDEAAAEEFMKVTDQFVGALVNKMNLANWEAASNITEYNLQQRLKVSIELYKESIKKYKEFDQFQWKNFKNEDLRRQFELSSLKGKLALPEEKYKKLTEIVSEMESIYGKAKVCDFRKKNVCNLSLEPDLKRILIDSEDLEEKKYIWKEWRKESGQKMRKLFQEYVELSNEAARLNNLTNNKELWLKDFEMDDFEGEAERLWGELEPLYKQLHAYVRYRLRKHYGEQVIPKNAPLPAHILGNMWSQSWVNIYNLTIPFPGKESLDVTPHMVKQGYTPLKMFQMADDFFASINLTRVPELFWNKSIIEKPEGRELICHASAWDFHDGKDFRIKMCTEVNQEDFSVIHHEMGHIQYFIQYKDQPYAYRKGANSGFHEAIGDVMILSTSTVKHLKRIGLLSENFKLDEEETINHLFFSALGKVATLPFTYLVDQWRWRVFDGSIKPEDYNCQWWYYRTKYQGISPATERTEEDFDAGAKYHVASDTEYIIYFVSNVLQFQFHKALCQEAGQYIPDKPLEKPLHECDIYQSTAAGNKLGKMLQMGASKKWPDALEVITGTRQMSAQDLLEYYMPLYDWLKKENEKNGEVVGWDNSLGLGCKKST